MPKHKKHHTSWLRAASLRLTRIRFALLFFYAVSVAVFDSAHLMAPEIITQRAWLVATALGTNIALWYLSHANEKSTGYYRKLIFSQLALDIIFASLSIYTDRGVASREVLLYAMPIIGAATLVSKKALFATAAMAVAAYFAASMRYYYKYPNEMYHVELYGMLALYSITLFIFAALLWVVVRARK